MHCSKRVSFWGTSYSRPHIDPYLTSSLLQNPGGATEYSTQVRVQVPSTRIVQCQPAMPAAHGQGPGASRGLLAALRLAAKAIPPARIDIVNPRDSDAIDDRPDDVSILWKNAAQTSPSQPHLYLPTVILTIILYSINQSLFHSRLKTFLFCKSFPLQPFLFLLQESLHGFPRLLSVISEHICFLLSVFSVFTLFSCRFRAVD